MKLDLHEILDMADLGGYAGIRYLSQRSVATLMSVASFLYEFKYWKGADNILTPAEEDAVDELISDINFELSDVTLGGQGMFKLAEAIITSDVVEYSLAFTGADDYKFLRLMITGLRTNRTPQLYDGLKLQFNYDTVASHYYTSEQLHNNTVGAWLEKLGTVGHCEFGYCCATSGCNAWIHGGIVADIRGHDASNQMVLDALYSGNSSPTAQGWLVQSRGLWVYPGELTSITIKPLVGTTFLVDPVSGTEPHELVIKLYGYA